MDLEEMLALLVDNTSGDISAADMRTIVTGLYDNTAALSAKVDSIEQGSEWIAVSGEWMFNPIAAAEPAGPQFTSDLGSLPGASWLRFAEIDYDDKDLAWALTVCTSIYIQSKAEALQWIRYGVSATPTDAGTYVQIPVSQEAGAGPGSQPWQQSYVVLRVPLQALEGRRDG